MVSIRPILKRKGEIATIYIRFKSGAKHDYTLKTDFVVNAKDWKKNK